MSARAARRDKRARRHLTTITMSTAYIATSSAPSAQAWPALPLGAWRETYATLHRWTQIIGKTRLALAPPQNHWWQVPLYVTARGLATSVIPYEHRSFEIEFDFLDHSLVVRTSDGPVRALPLISQSVAEFYLDYQSLLRSLGISVEIWPVPVELEDATPFAADRHHASYDADAAERFWRVIVQVDRVLKQFRGDFIGKCSPAHVWWGAFDIACTRFSGRRAPVHPGGAPHLTDGVVREAYSHECISAGWWPGTEGGPVAEPAFYAYAYPEPPGYSFAAVGPDGAHYDDALREWILPYDVVRTASNPDEALLGFLQSTYAEAADRGGWDRGALERR
jgi:hypothetical protein